MHEDEEQSCEIDWDLFNKAVDLYHKHNFDKIIDDAINQASGKDLNNGKKE